MRTILIVAATLLALTVAAVAMGPRALDDSSIQSRYRVVADLDQIQMLDSHQPMMEQMRAGANPQMTDRMPTDPMRQMLDPSMIDMMERNQAEIDRMLAR